MHTLFWTNEVIYFGEHSFLYIYLVLFPSWFVFFYWLLRFIIRKLGSGGLQPIVFFNLHSKGIGTGYTVIFWKQLLVSPHLVSWSGYYTFIVPVARLNTLFVNKIINTLGIYFHLLFIFSVHRYHSSGEKKTYHLRALDPTVLVVFSLSGFFLGRLIKESNLRPLGSIFSVVLIYGLSGADFFVYKV